MARIHSKNTSPELAVRRILRDLGFSGYRLHRKDVPGHPDIAFLGRRKVIFVHGCFWHRHARCPMSSKPKTRTDFWEEKFKKNVNRDRKNYRSLKNLGWSILVIWECELRNFTGITKKIGAFLEEEQKQ